MRGWGKVEGSRRQVICKWGSQGNPLNAECAGIQSRQVTPHSFWLLRDNNNNRKMKLEPQGSKHKTESDNTQDTELIINSHDILPHLFFFIYSVHQGYELKWCEDCTSRKAEGKLRKHKHSQPSPLHISPTGKTTADLFWFLFRVMEKLTH